MIEPILYKKQLPGKSNAHLIQFNDGYDYVVKFLRPGFEKSLANEWVGYCIARYMNLPVPYSCMVEILPDFLTNIPNMNPIILTKRQFASRFLPGCVNGHEAEEISDIVNKDVLANIIVFDYWLMNHDRTRKNILLKEEEKGRYHLSVIDHAEIFHSYNWQLSDLDVLYKNLIKSLTHKLIASFIDHEDQFWEQIDIMQKMPALLIEEIVDLIPEDWLVSKDERKAMTGILVNRRKREVPKLVHRFIKRIYRSMKNG